MKIKTITCHNVYNVGASLQAYALAAYLTGLGHEVQIVDYVPEYLRHYKLWTAVSRSAYDKPIIRQLYNLAKLPGRLKDLGSLRSICNLYRQERSEPPMPPALRFPVWSRSTGSRPLRGYLR